MRLSVCVRVANKMQFCWDALPADLSDKILSLATMDIIAHEDVELPELAGWRVIRTIDHEQQADRIVRYARLSKTFARAFCFLLDLYSRPTDNDHANRFVGAVLRLVFARHPCGTSMPMNSKCYQFLFTQIHAACTHKDPHNQAPHYYRLLGRTLTDLLKGGVLPWKEIDCVSRELRRAEALFRYIDRYHVKRYALHPICICLQRAYLEGSPYKSSPPSYYDPPLIHATGRIDYG